MEKNKLSDELEPGVCQISDTPLVLSDEEEFVCWVCWKDYDFILSRTSGLSMASGGRLQAINAITLAYIKPSGMVVYLPGYNPEGNLVSTLEELDSQIDTI